MSYSPPALFSKSWFVPACVALFTLALCAATISPASNFDGYMVWRFCQRILQGVPYDESVWDHRTARFGVVLPALLVQAVFGTSVASYYLVTSLTTAAAATATFLLGRAVVNTWVGLLATASAMLSPVVCLFSDCQLTAELFSMTFVPLCLLYGLRLCESGKTSDLLGCSLWFGASYFAKETNLFFGPAVVWLLFRYAPRRWTTLAVFCATNLALFALETSLYRAFTEQRLGRASVILGNHLHNRAPIEESLPSFWHLFRRFTELRIDMALPIYAFLGAAVVLWLTLRRAPNEVAPPHSERPPLAKLWWVIAPTLCFLLLTTFGVRSINPLKVVQPFRDRYLLPCFGLEWLTIWALIDARSWLTPLRRWFEASGRRAVVLTAAAALLAVLSAHVGLRSMKRHAPTEERAFNRAVEAALATRTPMLAPAGDRKTMLYIQSFLWDRYQLPDWQVATLPNHREVMMPLNDGASPRLEQRPVSPTQSHDGSLAPSDAEALLRSELGKPMLRTEYSYVYRAKPGTLSEDDFKAGRQVIDKD